MIDAEHSLHLEERAIDLVLFEKLVLSDGLDGVWLLLFAIQVGEKDFTEGAGAYLQLRDEVLQLEGWLADPRLLQATFRHFGLLLLINFSGGCLALFQFGELGRIAK